MRGKSHVITNTAIASVVTSAVFLFSTRTVYAGTIYHEVSNKICDVFLNNGQIPLLIFLPVAVFMFVLGSLLPDIDHPHSAIGRYIHLPIAHRTWTHALWLPIGFMILGYWYAWGFWIAAGYLGHLFWDSLSATGIQWLYPKKNTKHSLKLYHTSQASEYVLVTLVTIASIAADAYILYTFFHLL